MQGIRVFCSWTFQYELLSAKLGVLFVWFGKKGNLTVKCEIKYYSPNT
jgi:hypothetical protein